MEKDVVTVPAYFIPDTSWYRPVEIKGSPRERDEYARRQKKKGWIPKRLRKHPKILKAFGTPKKKSMPQKRLAATRVKRKPERFNRLVEQAYKNNKL